MNEGAQIELVESTVEDFGFKDWMAGIHRDIMEDEALSEKREENIQKDLRTLGTALSMTETLESSGFRPMELGGWATFLHLYDQEVNKGDLSAYDLMKKWRGSDDSDKYIAAEAVNGNQSIKSPIQHRYGSRNSKGETVERANNSYNGEDKFNAYLEVREGESREEACIEFDLLHAQTPEDETYSFEDAETVEIAGLDVRVPDIQEMLNSKLAAYANNKNAGTEDSIRRQDKADISSLLNVAEQKDISLRELYDETVDETGFNFDPDESPYDDISGAFKAATYQVDDNLMTFTNERFAPSQEYLDQDWVELETWGERYVDGV